MTTTNKPSNDIIFTVEFNIKPVYRNDFLNSLTTLAEEMSKEDTFVYTYLHEDNEDPNKFMIYERWSEPSFVVFVDNQLKGKKYRDDYESKISEWSTIERKITIHKPISQWHK